MSRLTHAQTSLLPPRADWVPVEVPRDLPMWEGRYIRDPGKDSDSVEKPGGQLMAETW